MRFHRFVGVLTGVMLALLVDAALVNAESYVAGQLGVTIPNNLSSVEIADTSGATIAVPGSRVSNLQLSKSVMYGAKLGHYFETMPAWLDLFQGRPWLGLETELFNTHPDIKNQVATATIPGFGAFPFPIERDLRVLTWAINIVARYPGKRWQPYAGIGLGVFFSHLSNDAVGDSRSSTSPGLNTQLGIRYLFTDRLSAFGEYKFNHTRLDFEENSTQLEFKGTYNAHILAFGIGYHF